MSVFSEILYYLFFIELSFFKGSFCQTFRIFITALGIFNFVAIF